MDALKDLQVEITVVGGVASSTREEAEVSVSAYGPATLRFSKAH